MTARSGDRLPRIGRALCLAGAAIGFLGFLGWVLGLEALSKVIPTRPAMMPDTGAMLALAGLAAALRAREAAPRWQKSLSACAGALVLAMASAIVAEYVLGVDLGIDELLFRTGTPGPFPGRPSPPTALALAMLGGALVVFDVTTPRGAHPREWLSLGAAALAFAALVGHLYGVGSFYQLEHAPVIGVAVHSGTAILLLAIGLLLERPRSGIMRLVTGAGPGSLVIQRLGAASMLTPLVVGLVLARGASLIGLGEVPLLLAILTTAMAMIGSSLVVVGARPLERIHSALEASRAGYRNLLEHAPDGIFVADLDGRYTDVNGAGCRLLQCSREEIIGKTIIDFIPPEDVARLWQTKEQLLLGGIEVSEWKMRRKDGSLVPVEVSAQILSDGRWQGFVRDLTSRRAADEAVRRWKERLDGIVSIAADAIVSIDDQQRITIFNQGAEEIFGWTKEEVLGKPLAVLLPERNRELHRRHVDGFAQEPSKARSMAERRPVFGLRKNGEEFPVEAAISKLESGTERVLTVMLRDITAQEKHLAEQRYFSRVGEALASTLDYREMITLVARASVPFLGDVCSVLVAEDGMAKMEIFHADPALHHVVDRLARFAPTEHSLLRRSFETRRPALVRELAPDFLRTVAQDEEHLRLLELVGPKSVVVVPLLAHGRCRGAISFSATGPVRRYGEDDLRLAEELGRRFALAVDNAFLYDQLRLQGTIAAHLSEGVLLIRVEDAVIVYANPRFEEMFGYAPAELIGRPVSVVNAPGTLSREQTAEEIRGQLRRTGTWHGELENVKKDGTRIWCYASASAFEHPRFGPVWVAVHTDISGRKRLEEERALALKEKEVLLKEIHHRVKNNLQVISSLFYLQARRTEDPQLRQLIDESRGRVQSIALVHDQLYRSRSVAEIDFGEYLGSLIAGIEATYGSRRIATSVDARGVFLDIEHAVPCGLLVCELISNAFKHAFPGERPGKVMVSARDEGARAIVLEVADDGVGIPEGVDLRGSRTLGLQLVQSLTAQLRGSIALDRSGGTHFTVRFQLPPSPEPGSAAPEALSRAGGASGIVK